MRVEGQDTCASRCRRSFVNMQCMKRQGAAGGRSIHMCKQKRGTLRECAVYGNQRVAGGRSIHTYE
eukprot:1158716-Pelagomonas_calceolata.AAC.3